MALLDLHLSAWLARQVGFLAGLRAQVCLLWFGHKSPDLLGYRVLSLGHRGLCPSGTGTSTLVAGSS